MSFHNNVVSQARFWDICKFYCKETGLYIFFIFWLFWRTFKRKKGKKSHRKSLETRKSSRMLWQSFKCDTIHIYACSYITARELQEERVIYFKSSGSFIQFFVDSTFAWITTVVFTALTNKAWQKIWRAASKDCYETFNVEPLMCKRINIMKVYFVYFSLKYKVYVLDIINWSTYNMYLTMRKFR